MLWQRGQAKSLEKAAGGEKNPRAESKIQSGLPRREEGGCLGSRAAGDSAEGSLYGAQFKPLPPYRALRLGEGQDKHGNISPPWLQSWTLTLASGTREILGEHTEVRRQAEAALSCFAPDWRRGRCWDCSGLRPCMIGSQLPEVGSSPWDSTTLCLTAHGSWTASALSP